MSHVNVHPLLAQLRTELGLTEPHQMEVYGDTAYLGQWIVRKADDNTVLNAVHRVSGYKRLKRVELIEGFDTIKANIIEINDEHSRKYK